LLADFIEVMGAWLFWLISQGVLVRNAVRRIVFNSVLLSAETFLSMLKLYERRYILPAFVSRAMAFFLDNHGEHWHCRS
jgi:hypothetical protein